MSTTGEPLAVGQPVAPWRLASPTPSEVELRATSPRGEHILLAYATQPRMDPRDVCFVVARQEESPAEADENCEVRTPGVTLFSHTKDPAVVAGYAGRGVDEVTLHADDVAVELPLSRHRGFLAILPPGAEGEIEPAPSAHRD